MAAVSADMGCAGPPPSFSNITSSGCMACLRSRCGYCRFGAGLMTHCHGIILCIGIAVLEPLGVLSVMTADVTHRDISRYLPPRLHALWLEDAEDVTYLGSQSSR